MEKKFSIEYTNLLKGVAVLLLLLHHTLNPGYPYISILPENIMEHWVSFGKVCVAIFLMLSGYGMYLSYDKSLNKGIKQDIYYIASHTVKLLLSFWVIYILFVPASMIFGYSFIEVYGKTGHLWINMLTDFLGMAYLRGTPSMNPTWWYLDVILVFYLISPITFRIIKMLKKKSWVLFGIIMITTFNFYGLKGCVIYFIPYLLGTVMAETKIIENMLKFARKMEWMKQGILLLVLFIVVYIREVILINDLKFYKLDWIPAFIIIYMSFFYISTTGKTGRILISLGKESGNIFLFHSFIYKFWLQDLVYGKFKYSVVIYIVFLIICYFLSKLLGYVEDKIGLNNSIKKLNQSRGGVIAMNIYVLILLGSFIPMMVAYAGIGKLSISTVKAPIQVGNARRLEVQNNVLCRNYIKAYWTSTNDEIVKVSGDGVITAQKEGTAEVIYHQGRKQVLYKVVVEEEK